MMAVNSSASCIIADVVWTLLLLNVPKVEQNSELNLYT